MTAVKTYQPKGLPAGFSIELDSEAAWLDRTTLFGGSPPRMLRFTAAGRRAMDELDRGPVHDWASATVARRVTDAGAGHPRPPAIEGSFDATVVIPVRDRARQLDRVLGALGRRYPVVVVDDGSSEPTVIAGIVATHGASLRRHDVNRGPGAARNTGVAAVTSEFIVLIDSDCTPTPEWIEHLAAHLADPLVGAVAPRVRPGAITTPIGRYHAARGALDLGDRPARVAPLTRVPYVPTAALVVRRGALDDVALADGPFDEALRYGEDVDLMWRLHDAGWQIRYDPTVEVHHDEPETFTALLARRFRYGTSAGQLAVRHPAYTPPLILAPLPAAGVVAVLARRPFVAAAAAVASLGATRATLRRAQVPNMSVATTLLGTTRTTWLGIGRYATQFAAPALIAVVARRAQPRGRRVAAASLLFGPPLASWVAHRPRIDPVRYVAAYVADDVAYGSGVIVGALRARSIVPLRPVFRGWGSPRRSMRSSARDRGSASRSPTGEQVG